VAGCQGGLGEIDAHTTASAGDKPDLPVTHASSFSEAGDNEAERVFLLPGEAGKTTTWAPNECANFTPKQAFVRPSQ
jgi:hypothetical protein